MATVFQPTSSKSFFVGRESERKTFVDVLTSRQPEWIIHIPGEGGIGKTRLLETLREDAQSREKVLVTGELVDFYNLSYQTGFGLLQEVARQLGRSLFEHFFQEREEFDRLLQSQPDPGQRQEAMSRVTDAFLEDYERLLRNDFQAVWLLDTCEEMRAVESFVLRSLLPRIGRLEEELFEETEHDADELIRRQTVVVIAGRKELEFPDQFREQVLHWRLPPLTQDEVNEFFLQGEQRGEISTASSSNVDHLYQLSGGRPLYVALSYDWLKNEIGTWQELLSLDEPFGEKLVGWVRRLDTLEKQAILYTAVAWRRMEPSLLAQLLRVSGQVAQDTIQRLSNFSFVKYRMPSEGFLGAFQLHDEMRALVTQYVEPQEGQITRRSIFEQVIAWYENRIGDKGLLQGMSLPSQSPLPEDEARALMAEWLFYQAKIDLDNAFGIHERIFRNAVHYLDLAFCDLLNQEIERFSESFSEGQRDDLRFRQALAAFRREEFGFASNVWHSLVRRENLRPYVRATTLMLLCELDSYTGKPDEALEHAQESQQIYESLIANETDLSVLQLLEIQMGQLFNNWGYAQRVKGNGDKALELYEKALQSRRAPKNVARSLNNMGYVYFQKGDITQARTYVGQAQQIRRKLKIPYELGLGYNTLGIIMEQSGRLDDASDSYHKALREFEAARSERGESLVLVNLGRIARTTNQFSQSISYLDRARQVFEHKQDKDYLIVALNELACTYRQRGEKGDWTRAEELHKESLKYSEELGKIFEQADNWTDLCILWVRMANEDRKQGKLQGAGEYAEKGLEAAERVGELAKKPEHIYLLAKKERALGDLTYGLEQFEQAFGHYFESCRLMAEAKLKGTMTPILSQRRYEEMVDRLQEQLQALSSPSETEKYVEMVHSKLEHLDAEGQENLSTLRDFLDAASKIAKKTSRP